MNNVYNNLSQDSQHNITMHSDRVDTEKRGQIPQKPITSKMRLVEMKKNNFESTIQEKLDE